MNFSISLNLVGRNVGPFNKLATQHLCIMEMKNEMMDGCKRLDNQILRSHQEISELRGKRRNRGNGDSRSAPHDTRIPCGNSNGSGEIPIGDFMC